MTAIDFDQAAFGRALPDQPTVQMRYRGAAYARGTRAPAPRRDGVPLVYRGIAYTGGPRVAAPPPAPGQRRYRGVAF
ncbi:hypothetical protein KUV62_00325 [Salipiger bermudensis]|uniref:hypothetical protein n=1 Tax=Salipiger bermudensis TaxID=344736 RepID=UPI001C9A21B9|nr:hypothetical protein [Salipiger bermudensis]MBY6002333.1 hypothetical protein [Salipiger bermudensis]